MEKQNGIYRNYRDFIGLGLYSGYIGIISLYITPTLYNPYNACSFHFLFHYPYIIGRVRVICVGLGLFGALFDVVDAS